MRDKNKNDYTNNSFVLISVLICNECLRMSSLGRCKDMSFAVSVGMTALWMPLCTNCQIKDQYFAIPEIIFVLI